MKGSEERMWECRLDVLLVYLQIPMAGRLGTATLSAFGAWCANLFQRQNIKKNQCAYWTLLAVQNISDHEARMQATHGRRRNPLTRQLLETELL